MGLTLVLGGTRSGKSAHAEALAATGGLPVRYLATADPDDGSMAARIAAHVLRRPPEWETIDVGDDLAGALRKDHCVLLDGLGTWIAGVMFRGGDVSARIAGFVQAIAATHSTVIVVAEQAGAGLLPPDPLSRDWLDLLGEATQALGEVAERALLVVAGRAIELPPGTAAAAPDHDDEALRHHGDTLVRPGDADHAVNILAGGPPPWLREALARALDEDVAAYPRETETVAALATLHGRAPEEIVPANGAAQALWLLPAALRPRLAACVHPGFTETEAALRAHGVPVTRVLRDPEDGFALRPRAVPEAADLVVVGNPASPSGTLDPAATILAAAPARPDDRRRRGVHGHGPRRARLARARPAARRHRRALADEGAGDPRPARGLRRRAEAAGRPPARGAPAVVVQRARAGRAARDGRAPRRARRGRRARAGRSASISSSGCARSPGCGSGRRRRTTSSCGCRPATAPASPPTCARRESPCGRRARSPA